MLLERDRMGLGAMLEPDMRIEGVRLGDFVGGFKVAVAFNESEHLSGAARAHGLERDIIRGRPRAALEREPKAGRHAAFLEDFKQESPLAGLDPLGLVVIVSIAAMSVTVTMMVVPATAQQEHAGDIDQQSEHRDRNGLVEADRNRRNEARDRLV